MILGGDLGGTKTLLAMAEQDAAGGIRIVRQQRFASADYATFELMLDEFLADRPSIAAACFGVAGPTDGRNAKLTYLPWSLAASELGRRFAIPRVTLANDFAAAAHGLPLVEPERIVTLHAGSYGWPGDRSLAQVRHFDAKGKLAISGVTNEVAFPITMERDGAETLKFKGSYKAKMTAFGITPPEFTLLGMGLRTGDDITLTWTWTTALKKAEAK